MKDNRAFILKENKVEEFLSKPKDIELVVKLPEKVYKQLIKYGEPLPRGNRFDDTIMKAVANGKRLPKNHNIELPYPLCIVEDRYSGAYSGASFLAFNMYPSSVSELPIDASDAECQNFWDGNDKDYALGDYVIGKGNTPEEALQNLISLLDLKEV